ncbi:beta-carotene hydroxylase [Sorangium sp. So ce1099]|uniref:beta-carotene hydroxylase n=1 Tax=Sorangium sp. So ce1099 TaxID=3133331 RepID=UPI003F614D09
MTLSHAIWIVTALAAFAAMEGWAALLHGKVWHHALWSIHRSHHARRRGLFERNDALSFLHAPVAVALILYGCMGAPGFLREAAFGFGLGMTAFGFAYVLVHDGLVHRRLPVSGLARVPYLARVRDAHRVHHSTGGAPYGLFLGPLALARRAAASALAAAPAATPLQAIAAAPPRSGRRRAPPSGRRRAPQRAR